MAAEGKEYEEVHQYLQPEFGNRVFKKTAVYKWRPQGKRTQKIPQDPVDHVMTVLTIPHAVP
jgi:hypothetical protein